MKAFTEFPYENVTLLPPKLRLVDKMLDLKKRKYEEYIEKSTKCQDRHTCRDFHPQS